MSDATDVSDNITMNDTDSLMGWALAGVTTIISLLSGLVAMFYKKQIADYDRVVSELRAETQLLRTRADRCEVDREEIRIRYAVLEQRVSDLEVTKKNRDSI